MIGRRVTAALVQPAADEVFSPAETGALPDAVRRYFAASLRDGVPLARSARLWMRGSMKIGTRWLPFRAGQMESPHRGFVWAARAGTAIVGSDRFVDGRGAMSWRLLGVVPVAKASGADVDRSAAGRGMAEAIWVPTALLPRFGVRWTEIDRQNISASYELLGHLATLQLTLSDDGLMSSVSFDRWGDPEGTGSWGLHRFGFRAEGHRTFEGITIPVRGAAGWYFDTDRWEEGEFFRCEIVRYELLGLPHRRQEGRRAWM
jgi:hypothetical protein